MTKFKIGSFIILGAGTKLSDLKNSYDREYTAVVSDPTIFSLDAPIPVIIQGSKCVGLAHVTGFRVTNSTTKVQFSLYKVSQDIMDMYYSAYRMSAGMSADDDSDVGRDQFIPGAVGAGLNAEQLLRRGKKKAKSGHGYEPRPKGGSIASIADDFPDDDDDY